jgi:nitrogen fixation protein NifU and related proteins
VISQRNGGERGTTTTDTAADAKAAELRDLYQSVILDHNRAPRNYGEPVQADGRADGTNPLCGDEVTVWVKLDGDRIGDVRFVGSGCAISRASASMMTAAVKGHSVADAIALTDRFQGQLTGQDAPTASADHPDIVDQGLGRLAPLAGVGRYPMRVKCATLAWHALRSAITSATASER